MQATVSKTFRFEAAHYLPNHDGKCRNLHGHSYKVVVKVRGPINEQVGHPKEGMVVDFSRIKVAWTEIMPMLDHSDLNESLGIVTTAENIAALLLHEFRTRAVPVTSIEVWETETSCAEVDYREVWANGG